MRQVGIIAMLIALSGCGEISVIRGDSISEAELESFFRKHKVEGNRPVALKKRSIAGIAYLATVHGYPNNLSVCEELIAPYNDDTSLSVLPGDFFCEVLR